MLESKPSHPSEGKKLKIPTDRNNEQASKPKNYRCNKPRNKPIPDPKDESDLQGQCTDSEGYIFDLGLRSYDKFSRTIKELERYLGATYSDSCQTEIMTENAATFPNPYMSTITDLGTKRPPKDADMTTSIKITSMKLSAKI